MKLSKIYSNKPNIFTPVKFLTGLNVIFAEIRLPENKKKDTHNLGKTTFGRLLDFCFLSKRESDFFLFKHSDLFEEFVFFLEIELKDASYVTIRRSVQEHSKICFKKHFTRYQDFSTLTNSEWDHCDIPFERARILLDGLLDWRELKPSLYRKSLGYLLRSQDDFQNVFKPGNYRTKDSDWKPFLALILGFEWKLIEQQYKKEEELKEKKSLAKLTQRELGGSTEDSSKIEGILLLKQEDVKKNQRMLESFDFRIQDIEKTRQLVDEIDEYIAKLNAKRYSLNQARKKILSSLEEDQILFNPEEAQSLFEEVGILFSGQLKKDYHQLIAFNKAITIERRNYLQEEYSEIESELKSINENLDILGKQRSDTLSFLSETNIFDKYKKLSNEIVTIKSDIVFLERQREFLNKLYSFRDEIRELMQEIKQLQVQIEKDVENQNSDKDSLFSKIRLYFNDIIEDVIDRKALLSVSTNKEGHLEFKAEILDESGNTTSADMGHTYRKLLCIAFDMAILRAHIGDRYPRFVFHDGVFESLDDRKKENLLSVIHRYTELGIQSIITLIDSDLPKREKDEKPVFDECEKILLLHDENEQGRLFKMKPW